MEPCDLNALDLTLLLRKKEISALEIVDSCLKRVAAVDGRPGALENTELTEEDKRKVHAFITLADEHARAQAAQVDRAIGAGEDPGALAGVPFTVKDIFCVKDTPSTAASKILANFTAPYTATPVKRMQNAGAIMLGKVNSQEFHLRILVQVLG